VAHAWLATKGPPEGRESGGLRAFILLHRPARRVSNRLDFARAPGEFRDVRQTSEFPLNSNGLRRRFGDGVGLAD
jgi:hypothetical protein